MEDPIELIRSSKRTTDEENTCQVPEPATYTWYIIGIFAIIIVIIIVIIVMYMRSNTSTDEALQQNLQNRFTQGQPQLYLQGQQHHPTQPQLQPQLQPQIQQTQLVQSPTSPTSPTAPTPEVIIDEQNSRKKSLLDQEEKLKALIAGTPITLEEVEATKDNIQEELDSTKKSTLSQQDDELIDSIFTD